MALLKLVGFTGLRNQTAAPTVSGWGTSIPSIFRVNAPEGTVAATYLNDWVFTHASSSSQGLQMMDGESPDHSIMRMRIDKSPATCALMLDIRHLRNVGTPIGATYSVGFSVKMTGTPFLPIMYVSANSDGSGSTIFGQVPQGVMTYLEFSLFKASATTIAVTRRVNEGNTDRWNLVNDNVGFLLLGNHSSVSTLNSAVTLDIGDMYFTYNEDGTDERMGAIKVRKLPTTLLSEGSFLPSGSAATAVVGNLHAPLLQSRSGTWSGGTVGKEPVVFGVDSSFDASNKNILAVDVRGFGKKVDTTSPEYLSVSIGDRVGEIIAKDSQLLMTSADYTNSGLPAPNTNVTDPSLTGMTFRVSGTK